MSNRSWGHSPSDVSLNVHHQPNVSKSSILGGLCRYDHKKESQHFKSVGVKHAADCVLLLDLTPSRGSHHLQTHEMPSAVMDSQKHVKTSKQAWCGCDNSFFFSSAKS